MNPRKNMKLLLNKAETCTALSISLRTLYNLVKSGEIKECHIGTKPVYKVTDIQAYVNSLGGDCDASQAIDIKKKPRGRPRLAV
jgi:hypothetical protein